MKFQILAFFLLSVVFIHAQDPDLTFFYLLDSSNSTVTSADGESQYFDYPSGVNLQFEYNISNPSNLFLSVLNNFVQNFSIPVTTLYLGQVATIKTYWRHAGFLPMALVQSEMELSNEDQYHIPDATATMESVEYLFYNMAIPASQNPYEVKHQVSEICVKFLGNDFRHFIVDRGYNGIYPDTWNSRVRVIYTGKTSSCNLNDTNSWADSKSGNWSNNGVSTPQLHVLGQAVVNSPFYTLAELFVDITSYFQKFPNYNTLYNCQHF